MNGSSNRVGSAVALAISATAAMVAAGAWGGAHAQTLGKGKAVQQQPQQWSAWGGTVGVRWNRELAADLGFALGAASSRHAQLSWNEHETFDLRQTGTLDFTVAASNLRSFAGGYLQARGGYVLDLASGRIDLTDFRLVPRAPQKGTPPILDVVSADGKAWFYVDRLMYELARDKSQLAVRSMDLRITPELAQRIGQPEVAGWTVGEMEMSTEVIRQGADPVPLAGSTKWHGLPVPGVPGATYQADLFMSTFSMQYSRCDLCTGVGGNGRVVFTPSSTLRNNVNNGTLSPTVAGDPLGTSTALYAADIPWYSKFTGVFPPYNNDQHPYLIWNLYRFNADGTIDQIGRSGVKHAFLTLNTACLDDPADSHILGRGCSDVYSVSNNDSNNSLGTRAEIIPSSNIWGRCGSMYDTNCDGIANASGNGSYDQRLVVRESQFSGAAQTGATYLFESWYLAREDINIYNSMGTVRATFARSGSVWVVGGNDQYKLGPAIDRWVDPAAPGANASSTEIVTSEGRTKVAVKATDLGGGLWRYDYAVMNLDFSRALVDGVVPNQSISGNRGFIAFNVPVGAATLTNLGFSDGDIDASNDWVPSIAAGSVTWNSVARANSLDWGTMFRYSFTTNAPPSQGTATLRVGGRGNPQVLQAAVLVPGAAPLSLKGR